MTAEPKSLSLYPASSTSDQQYLVEFTDHSKTARSFRTGNPFFGFHKYAHVGKGHIGRREAGPDPGPLPYPPRGIVFHSSRSGWIPLPHSHALVRGSRPYLTGHRKFKREDLDNLEVYLLPADADPKWILDLVEPISYHELTAEHDLSAEVILLPDPDVVEDAESADDPGEMVEPKVKREASPEADPKYFNSWLVGPMILPVYITHHPRPRFNHNIGKRNVGIRAYGGGVPIRTPLMGTNLRLPITDTFRRA